MSLTKGNAKPIAGAEHQAPAATLTDTTHAATASALPADPPAQSLAAVVVPAHTGTEVVQSMQKTGFALLDDEIRFGSFPSIKLDKDKFILGDKEEVDEFTAHILSLRAKWIYKAGRGGDKKDEEIFYSYDQQVDTSGNSVAQRIADWQSQGLTLKETRKYTEVAVKMKDTTLADTLALLSIPPVSVSRLAGFRRQVLALHKAELDQILTKFCKGDKIKTQSGETFYPWHFVYAGKAEETVAEAE